MPAKNEVLAIVCSDLHLSHKPPPARAGEPNWYEAMKRPLVELANLASEHGAPIICAGDIFDTWRSPPELINFALENLPEMYAVPGQHDLPQHSMDNIQNSAYWTMVLANRVSHIPKDSPQKCGQVKMYGFGWGVKNTHPKAEKDGYGRKILNVAVVHRYMWVAGKSYKNVPQSYKANPEEFKGYDAVIVGDNHIPFEQGNIFNCGGFMRRKANDTHAPRVGLLMGDGSIKEHRLYTSKEVHDNSRQIENLERHEVELGAFFKKLRGLHAAEVDYAVALERAMRSMDPEPRAILASILSEMA